MSKLNDPLSSLISSDTKSVDRQKLAELLQRFVSIDQDTKEFGFLDAFTEIENNIGKIEILLAASKARALFLNEPDGLFPGDIITLSIMPAGSVKSSLKKLSDKYKIKQDKEGRYFIPAYHIPELFKQFNNQS